MNTIIAYVSKTGKLTGMLDSTSIPINVAIIVWAYNHIINTVNSLSHWYDSMDLEYAASSRLSIDIYYVIEIAHKHETFCSKSNYLGSYSTHEVFLY